jgi:hypothetical protein
LSIFETVCFESPNRSISVEWAIIRSPAARRHVRMLSRIVADDVKKVEARRRHPRNALEHLAPDRDRREMSVLLEEGHGVHADREAPPVPRPAHSARTKCSSEIAK